MYDKVRSPETQGCQGCLSLSKLLLYQRRKSGIAKEMVLPEEVVTSQQLNSTNGRKNYGQWCLALHTCMAISGSHLVLLLGGFKLYVFISG